MRKNDASLLVSNFSNHCCLPQFERACNSLSLKLPQAIGDSLEDKIKVLRAPELTLNKSLAQQISYFSTLDPQEQNRKTNTVIKPQYILWGSVEGSSQRCLNTSTPENATALSNRSLCFQIQLYSRYQLHIIYKASYSSVSSESENQNDNESSAQLILRAGADITKAITRHILNNIPDTESAT